MSGSSSSATTRPWRSAPLIVAASRTCSAVSCCGSRSRKGCWSRSRGTAITSVFPSSSARRRAWVWGESGFALITRARFQVRCPASFSAASLAPAKLGIRPSAPGKRETPSRSIAFQTARLTWSLDRIGAEILCGDLVSCRRTSLSQSLDRSPRGRRGGRRRSGCPSAGRPSRCASCCPRSSPSGRLNDWGRSERVEGAMDRTLVEFFYRYWFRAEVEGIENVPAEGGALLVSNHAGALPPDAAMIAKAIREEHPSPRPLYLTVEHFFKGYPGFSMLIPKIGGVAAHPANVHRLLYDERQLVLVFPEGRKGTEKLYKDRYRLRRFGRGGFVEAAMRAEAKLVPLCVVGAEEAAPVFAQVARAAEAHRADLLPAHADLPLARPARDARLPAGEVQDPVPGADRHGRARRGGGRRRQGAGPDGRSGDPRPDPGEPARDAREAKVACGSDERHEPRTSPARRPAGPGHRPLHLLGRAAGAGARGLRADRGDHRRRLQRPDAASSSAPSS